jgi:hypothetical protein
MRQLTVFVETTLKIEGPGHNNPENPEMGTYLDN